jgi:hypothetical protein
MKKKFERNRQPTIEEHPEVEQGAPCPSAKTTPEVPANAATPLALTMNTQIASMVARKSEPPLEATVIRSG